MKAADAPKYYPRGGPTMPRKPQSCNSMKDERHEMEMQLQELHFASAAPE
jgi:hypothetical protein